MTKIKIDHRRKQIWPWVLFGLVIAALCVYFLVFRDSDDTSDTNALSNPTDLLEIKENNSTVVTFISFIESDTNKMSLEHAYTNEALLKLIEATDAMAGELGYDIQADLEKVKSYANSISEDPFETTHADNIRNADDILTNVLQNIQMEKYPDLAEDVKELRNAADSIKPGILALDQKDAVKNYFIKASELLQKMN